jgi:serine protein kinase
MSGISTRFIMKSLDNALSDSERNMITPISIIDALVSHVKDQVVDQEERNRYLEILQKVIREEYLKILESEIAKAFIAAYEEQAQTLFDSYLDHAEAFVTRHNFKDPDEKFMRTIEECIGVVGSARDGFRSDVTAYMFAKVRRGEKVNYTSYGPLKEAIESYLITSVKDIARIVTKSKTRDETQKKKYNEMVKTLIDYYSYSEDSAEEILTFASNNLWRDS